MEFVYIFDKLPSDLTEHGDTLLDWADLPEITRIINQQYSFYGNYANKGQNKEKIKKGAWIKARTTDLSWQYFKIKTVKKTLKTISITAMHLGYEANRNFIQLSYTARGNGKQIMQNLKQNQMFSQPFVFDSDITTTHQFTAKEVNTIAAIIGENGGNQNLAGVTGGELEMDNYHLTLKKRIGKDADYRIDLGVNLESIQETVDDTGVVNSLYLSGGVPEGTDYDKEQEPVTYGLLEIDGVTDETRQIAKRENSECVTVEELKKWGQTLFDNDRIHEPSVVQEINMIALENTIEYKGLYKDLARLGFGDTVHCDISYLNIENVEERMIQCVWYPTIPKYKSIVLGNDTGLYTNEVNTTQSQILKKLETRSDELQNAVINATQWITGTKGGYVRFRPKDAPEEILIMDKPDADQAKKVWRWNLGGLGYSKNGVDGPFETAITQGGEIVADFITAGVLSGIDIHSKNAKYDIHQHDGTMDFKDANGNILGAIQGNSLEATNSTLKGLYILMYNTNPFSIVHRNGTTDERIFFIAPKGYGSAGDTVFNFLKNVQIDGSLHVDKLYVGGKEITAGSGGSSGGGTIPPSLTTEQEKNAWAIWQFLKSKGYSEQAAAAILGNMEQESGIMPDIDEGNGGPGYGLVQWTSPVAGESGRAYVQRLMKQAGITDDYRTLNAQLQLLEWHMYNGQYISTTVYPYSPDEFKKLTDISIATTAFERNFERPAVTHPERIGMAQRWYDLFKNLGSGETGWRNPVRSGYTVTQEWDQIGWGTGEIHGGIDLAGNTQNIYAAKSGTVETVTFDSTGGNYIIIDHGDGYWTYYGHLASFNVKQGDKVTTETIIGVMGSTGLSTGTHLHFEVWKDSRWNRINPRDVINL